MNKFPSWIFSKMLYELGNGRTVDMSPEYFCNMTDDNLRDLIAAGSGVGEVIDDPFFNSIIHDPILEDEVDALNDEDYIAARLAQLGEPPNRRQKLAEIDYEPESD